MRALISLSAICLVAACLSTWIGPSSSGGGYSGGRYVGGHINSYDSTAYRRVCYVTNWSQYRPGRGRWVPEVLDASLCTHVIFAFAKVVGNAIRPYEENDKSTNGETGMYERLNNMKTQNPHMKTLLGVGGWTHGSPPFTAMVGTAADRREFALSAVEYLRQWNFDGLDVDWEYPAGEGIDDYSPPHDRERFVLLLQELRRAFEADAVSSGNDRLLLAIAGAAAKAKLDSGYDMPRIASEVDFINVMTYDFHGQWDPVTGMNSPLTGRAGESDGFEYFNLEFAAEYYVSLGAPREMLNIGLALYGRTFTLTNAQEHGVGAPARGGGQPGKYTRTEGFLSYYEICGMFEQGATRYWHNEHQCPYAVLGNQWVSYDDPESLQLKIDYITRSNYGGTMMWAVDLDDAKNLCGGGPYPLMRTIKNLLDGSGPVITMSSTSRTSSHTDGTTKAPQTSWTTAPTSGPVFDCKGIRNGFYPNPTSCAAYYVCASGTTFDVECTDGLLYDIALGYCTYANQVDCGSRPRPGDTQTQPTPRPTSVLVTQETPAVSTQGPSPVSTEGTPPVSTQGPSPVSTKGTPPVSTQGTSTGEFCQTHSNGKYTVPNDCGHFYECVDSVTYKMPCPLGLAYDDGRKLCDYRANVPGC